MPAEPPPLSTAEVAHLLGVKPATVYAYVSRGLLGRRRNADGKNSLFDRREVDAFLAARKRPTTPGIQTGITLIQDGFLYYRGEDAVQLARVASFEEVVALLWTGARQYADLAPDPRLRRLAETVIAPLPHTARHTDRLRVIVAAAAAGDPLRFDTSPSAVTATGRALLGTMVAALPAAVHEPALDVPTAEGADPDVGRPASSDTPRSTAATAHGGGWREQNDTTAHDAGRDEGNGTPRFAATTAQHPGAEKKREAGAGVAERRGRGSGGGRIAELLWERLTTWEAAPREHNLLDAALILLADHDIAASTLAARVAASTRAHPYAVVGAGLAALDGPLHGAASSLACPVLAEVMEQPDPVGVIAGRLRAGDPVPGFGHRLYPDGDPRAVALLDMLGDTRARDAAERLAEVMRARSGVRPNVDLALAALTLEYGMPADAGETIFAVARTAGWIAHALEEYADRPSRFRPSGEYAGQVPSQP
ncbi:helix-turn-helix domain-containing protein [Actinoplanes sp. LDG1-06]|uniref:citrate synthase (unknown stereospecificity) n=1 Tax=Paractinoplanes ovalisporus TaxID=2810368 RepID=A0ABS2AB80_9ACTN|nr:citrate/2-methylcitrate synthase [Actinoplanes ovalisporus]MBM2616549.1 helix-turn-helix domain-containing protein [Actinoplanes ovalisporus]